MEKQKEQTYINDNDKIIAEKIGQLLGEVRFFSEDDIPSTERIKTILKTKEELIDEISKSGSKNLFEGQKNSAQKEINLLLEEILTIQKNTKREKLRKITTIRDNLTSQQKAERFEEIKEILNDLHLFSHHLHDEKFDKKLDWFKKYMKIND